MFVKRKLQRHQIEREEEYESRKFHISIVTPNHLAWISIIASIILISCGSVQGFGTFQHYNELSSATPRLQTRQKDDWNQINSILKSRQPLRMKADARNSMDNFLLNSLFGLNTKRQRCTAANSLLPKSVTTRKRFLPSIFLFSRVTNGHAVQTVQSTKLFMNSNADSKNFEVSTISTIERESNGTRNFNVIITKNQSSQSVLVGHTGSKNLEKESSSNGHASNSTFESSSHVLSSSDESAQKIAIDKPQPTANGGYSHTASSKEKISQANKGRTPWNKGRKRSEEEKARISAGVRARNRERLLKKIADMGLTEEEYNLKLEQEKKEAEAKKAKRRTPKGGYIPTEETKAKISKILIEKHKNGEIKKRTKEVASKSRKGKKHSEETKKKISMSLKARWSGDAEYKENIKKKVKASNSSEDVRKRISDTLKKKWQDPEFREYMLGKIANRQKPANAPRGEEYRRKISESMKRKWEDPTYRAKAVKGMTNKASSGTRRKSGTTAAGSSNAVRKKKKKKKKKPPTGTATILKPVAKISASPEAPMKINQKLKKKVRRTRNKTTTSNKKKIKESSDKKVLPNSTKTKNVVDDVKVSKMKDERRDLYDLLYGEEERAEQKSQVELSEDEQVSDISNYDAAFEEDEYSSLFEDDDDDFNIDDFDPYGLDELEQSRF